MPYRLPLVPSVPSYRVGTTIEDVQYVLDVRWNARAEAWYIDILDEDETPLRMGMKVVLGAILGGRSALATMPRGMFTAYDTSGNEQDATLDDLGTRVVVYYYTEAEVAAA